MNPVFTAAMVYFCDNSSLFDFSF